MEMLFNELSINPLSPDKFQANDKMEKFAKTVGTARKKGFRNIRYYQDTFHIKLSEGYSLYDWLHNKDVPELYRNFLYGMIIQPFISNDDEELEEQFVNANYYYENTEHLVPKTECVGLAAAHLYETLSISLSSMSLWDFIQLQIIIEQDENISLHKVFNVSTKEAFENLEISDFVDSLGVVKLIKTVLEPDLKKIHLADHHGKAELQVFCKKLILNEYVVEMRSTNWGGSKFIRKTFSDGSIEIVLTNSERSYALWVQTTGRNMRETIAISKILNDKYS